MSLYADRLFPCLHDASIGALDRLRGPVVAQARGRVLELGAGSGLNFQHYVSHAATVTALEPSAGMLARAVPRAAMVPSSIRLVRASAETLPFPDASFDTVVATFVLCTIPDPARALAEAHRALVPGGSLLVLEHARDADPRIARWQRRLNPIWRVLAVGCHLDRDTLGLVRTAGFDLVEAQQGPPPFWTPPILRTLVRAVAQRA